MDILTIDKFFHSKIFIYGLILLLVLSAVGLYREIASTLKIRKEVGKLREEAQIVIFDGGAPYSRVLADMADDDGWQDTGK